MMTRSLSPSTGTEIERPAAAGEKLRRRWENTRVLPQDANTPVTNTLLFVTCCYILKFGSMLNRIFSSK